MLEKEIVVASGLVKIIENVDKIGQVISNPDVSVASFEFEKYDAHMSARPNPFTSRKTFSNIPEILDIASYYDESDRETYALIQFTCTNSTPVWTYAYHLLYYVSPNFAYTVRDMLLTFLRTNHSSSTGNTNIYYPLFSYVTANFEEKLYNGFIVSTDAHSQYTYGTILYTTDNTNQVLHQDLPQFAILTFSQDNLFTMSDIFVSAFYKEPDSYREAMQMPDAKEWKAATLSECHQMFVTKKCLKSVTLENLPKNTVIMDMRFIFKIKRNADGSLERYKVRLVCKGYKQIYGVHYTNTFAPTINPATFNCVLIISSNLHMNIYHLDVSAAFLNGDCKFENYIRLPEHFKFEGSEYALMLKNIYGTKDAALTWYEEQHSFLTASYPFLIRSIADPCFYSFFSPKLSIMLIVSVDDYAVSTTSHEWYCDFFQKYSSKYESRNLGSLSLYNGIHIKQYSNFSFTLSQTRDIDDLLERYGLRDANPISTPMDSNFNTNEVPSTNTSPVFAFSSIIGSLLWIARMTRPDITFPVLVLASFTKNFTEQHVIAAKRILRYLKGTRDLCRTINCVLSHPISYPIILPIVSMSDSDWGGDLRTRRSHSGGITLLFKSYVCSTCRKQDFVTLSTCEAELVALMEVIKDTLGVLNILHEFGSMTMFTVPRPITIYCDNISTQFVSSNRIFNGRTRHFDIRAMRIRETIESGQFIIEHIISRENIADMFTKILTRELLQDFRVRIGIVEFDTFDLVEWIFTPVHDN